MPRAAQRDSQRDPQRQPIRRRNAGQPTDRFYINPSSIPPGQTYEWKRLTYNGLVDTEHQIDLAENGWEPVPAGRHPEKAGRNAKPDESIVRGGQILMERPTEFTREARDEERDKSREQLRVQFLRLGQETRGSLPRTKPKARRTFEAAPPQASDDGA